MKSFVVTLLIWAVLFALLWFGAHELFYPPGDWIGALIASLSITLGIGGVRKARLERRDAALIAKPEGSPRDGERVAIAGTLERLDHHADVAAKEPAMQMTALDIAIANKNVEAAKVLREAGARPTR